ncbi:hypothetical protein RvY_02429-2 [Ramazzottius varieornatus]|uniref:Uncharacterized protein n=1 Tax=Ramazzottius varieornatus TaxID=947166 RepID=A0A1D1UUT6_RAMVA|nr:hypothetical protein RvY_02429-2 [Ramazzottius varieornatus]
MYGLYSECRNTATKLHRLIVNFGSSLQMLTSSHLQLLVLQKPSSALVLLLEAFSDRTGRTMGNASTSDAASDDVIPPPTMTIDPTSSTPNRNMKKRELDDDTVLGLEDFIKQFNIGDDVWVINRGQFHKAKIILIEADKYLGAQATSLPIYRIHHPGWGKR